MRSRKDSRVSTKEIGEVHIREFRVYRELKMGNWYQALYCKMLTNKILIPVREKARGRISLCQS